MARLLIESDVGGWIGVGCPVVDEVHMRYRLAAKSPVRCRSAVWSESCPNDIGGREGRNRADLGAVRAREKRSFRPNEVPTTTIRSVIRAKSEMWSRKSSKGMSHGPSF